MAEAGPPAPEPQPAPEPERGHWGGARPRRAVRLTAGRAVVLLIAWMGITLLGGVPMIDGQGTNQVVRALGGGLAWHIAVAAGFGLMVGAVMGQTAGWFAAPLSGTTRAMWLPLAYLAALGGLLGLVGLPPWQVAILLALNSLFVGLSEEVMFRGLLFRGLGLRFGLRGAVWASSLVFGAVHVLNALVTGNLSEAIAQAAFAAALGVVLAAMALRSGSLIWPILFHAAWDFGALSMGHFVASQNAQGSPPPLPGLSLAHFLPLALILPATLYALWLIRRLPLHPQALSRATPPAPQAEISRDVADLP